MPPFRFVSDHDRAPRHVLRHRETRDGRLESYLAPVERRPHGRALAVAFLALAVVAALIGAAR